MLSLCTIAFFLLVENLCLELEEGGVGEWFTLGDAVIESTSGESYKKVLSSHGVGGRAIHGSLIQHHLKVGLIPRV